MTDHAVSTQELIDLHADAVLVATGSRAARPGFAAEALASGAAVTAEDALRNTPSGNHVLILGGGLVGCETAEKLALQGKSVTILELRAELAPDMHPRARKFLLKSLREHGARFLLNTQVVAMERNGIVSVRDSYGNERVLPPYDSIILALGYKSDNTLCRELAAADLPFTPLGDCVKPGKIMDAIHAARQAACAL